MDKEFLSLVRDLKELLPLCFSTVMTDAEWEESKHPSKSQKRGSDLQGAGHYFTDDPEKASQFGDILYKVEVKYSTDRRTAKKTGREKDFQYDPETGYWVIPQSKEGNIKILAKGKTEYQGAGHGVKVI